MEPEKTPMPVRISTMVLLAIPDSSDGSVSYPLVKRSESDLFLPGKWAFAGGQVEKHESIHDCARRELKEELGVIVEGLQHIHQFIADEFEEIHVFLAHAPSDVKIRAASVEIETVKIVREDTLIRLASGQVQLRTADDGPKVHNDMTSGSLHTIVHCLANGNSTLNGTSHARSRSTA